AVDAALLLAGELAAQAWAGLAWRDLTDAQRGAVALSCVLTLMLLPRGASASAAVAGRWSALSRLVIAVACASMLTIVRGFVGRNAF
ncbi:undecaprenyl-phosphate glucose phosphotransferase, partial [Burkholderia pseudomallei]|nr:undecaprenyl-phosphate glucose phosphotransferase [Burkholderia pseudomallei]